MKQNFLKKDEILNHSSNVLVMGMGIHMKNFIESIIMKLWIWLQNLCNEPGAYTWSCKEKSLVILILMKLNFPEMTFWRSYPRIAIGNILI